MEVQSKASPTIVLAITSTVALWAVHIYMREALRLLPGDPIRLVATALLVLSFSWVVLEYVRVSRKMDEFHRRVQFLALAIAYPCSLVLIFAVGFFRAEGLLAGSDPRDLPSLILLSGGLGYFIAWKRYS